MSLLLSIMIAAAPPAKADALAVTAIHNYGACVARMTPAGARETLAIDFRTQTYAKKLRSLAKGHGRCARPGAEIRFDGVLFAGAMAEALFEERDGAMNSLVSLSEPLAARTPIEALSLCTVVTSPAQVSRLFKTEVATDEEKTAVEALGPTLGACLFGAKKAELNRPGLRSVLALAAWRVANAVSEGRGGDR